MAFRLGVSAEAEGDFGLIFDHFLRSYLEFGESLESALGHAEARCWRSALLRSAECSTPPVTRALARGANGGYQYGSMIVACIVYPASPTSLRNA